MREYKIVFTGTMGAGKTTAIAAISETPPVVTDVANNDASLSKAKTTVGLDFGQLTLDTGDRLRLFGTPGQARFDFMWRILAQNALGIIILVDNSRPDPLADLDAYLTGFAEVLRNIPCTVGVGRMDSHTQPDLDAFSARLEAHGLVLPVLPVDVRRREDVALLIDTLLSQMESSMTGSET
ncbi:ATP/GTP-binding protein [Polaromonas sp.]|uniref:GTP-binding protein n=1 Tax=Polaromonas sp. TaxID=1869339 RepID=UPI003265EF91